MADTAETIVCPSCGAINRAPSARLAEGARPLCGSCRKPLFSGEPYEVRGIAEFERIISQTSIPVLVDFWAPWCGPCLVMAPHFKAAAKALEPRFRLLKVDTEQLPQAAAANGISSIPTLILFLKGRPVARQSGAAQAKAIEAWAQSQLAAI